MRVRHTSKDNDGNVRFLAYMDVFGKEMLTLNLEIFKRDNETKEELLKFFKEFIGYERTKK